MNLEVHGLEDSSLCLLIVLLAECLLGVSLVAIEVWHILIKLNCLSRNNQGSTTPKFLAAIHFLKDLIDVKAKGKGFIGE